MAPKRAKSAYFVFCHENRLAAKAECEAKSGGGKISVAVVAKHLGEKWQKLTDEQKSYYKKLAASEAAAAQEEMVRFDLNG